MINEIELLFNQEIRDKKRTGYGAYHNCGKRGSRGVKKLMFPVDFMSAKEKKLYTKGGECKVSNVFSDINNVPKLQELLQKDAAAVKSIILNAKEFHSTVALRSYWKVSSGKMYSIYDKFGITYNKRGYTKPIKNTNKEIKAPKVENKELINQQAQLLQAQQDSFSQIAVTRDRRKGFSISFFDEAVTGKDITDRLMNYIATLKDDAIYNIDFEVTEELIKK